MAATAKAFPIAFAALQLDILVTNPPGACAPVLMLLPMRDFPFMILPKLMLKTTSVQGPPVGPVPSAKQMISLSLR